MRRTLVALGLRLAWAFAAFAEIQEINGVKYPFDEKVVVAELLDEMRKGL